MGASLLGDIYGRNVKNGDNFRKSTVDEVDECARYYGRNGGYYDYFRKTTADEADE